MEDRTCDLPTKCLWLLFSRRARFHDKPGFPELRRWFAVDQRILTMARKAMDAGAVVTFYTHTVRPDTFDKGSEPFVQRFVEIRRPDTNIGHDRFLPSWLGTYPDTRKKRLHTASILFINKVY